MNIQSIYNCSHIYIYGQLVSWVPEITGKDKKTGIQFLFTFNLLQRDGSRFGESGNANRYWIWRWNLRNDLGIAMSLAPPIKLMVGIPPIMVMNGGWFMALLYQHYKISSTSLRSEMNIYTPRYSQYLHSNGYKQIHVSFFIAQYTKPNTLENL